MQEYDVALKLLLQGSATLTIRQLTGTAVTKWLDVELPRIAEVEPLRPRNRSAAGLAQAKIHPDPRDILG